MSRNIENILKILIIIVFICFIYVGSIYIKVNIENSSKEDLGVFNEIENATYNEENNTINYDSPSMKLNIEKVTKTNPSLNMWIVDIKLESSSQIKSAFAGDKFSLSKKERTSDIAKRHNAILAVNGAAAGFNKKSYVIRDGIVYRDTRLDCDPLVIQEDGDFRIYSDQFTGEELIEKGAKHTYDFGPDLIRSGKIVDYGDTWFKVEKAPRTAIGQKGPLEYVIIVVDGRSKESVGISLYDLAVELQNRGCYWGYNLDGGGSTTLYFNGKVLNNPSDWDGERKISDILYFDDL